MRIRRLRWFIALNLIFLPFMLLGFFLSLACKALQVGWDIGDVTNAWTREGW